jgi:two-component system phosphate regulon sensor histidine kinase PhoR
MTDAARQWASSYRVRLALGYVIIVALFAGLWGWSLFGPLTETVIEQQQTHLQSVAQAGVLVLGQPGIDLTASVNSLVTRTDLRMTVIASNGAVLADSEEDPTVMENHASRPEVAAALSGSIGRDIRESATQGVQQMYVAVPASFQGKRVALRVSESLERIRELSAQTRRTGLALLGAALIIALAVGARIAAVTARPVERLAEAAATMASGNLSASVPDESGALLPLAQALARLRVQLRDRIGALETEQTNLHAVLDGLEDAVFLLENDRIAVSNRAASELFSLSPTTRGRSLADVGLPASLASALRRNLELEATASAEIGPDPRGRSFRLTCVPLERTPQQTRSLVVIADITDRARVDRMRRDFVANASHELKTPTAGILLLAEMAENAATDGDTPQALAFVSQIRAEAGRMRQLILDLLDLSRLETGPAEGAITDVREAIELSLAAHSRAASAKGLALEADFSAVSTEDAFVVADRTDMAVALDNLLANAIAYTPAGRVTASVAADDANVRIVIADTGVGIPPEDLPRVFERFYRVDRSRVRDSGGTGLGLSLVRHVVERSGGHVAIDSAPGTGTRVTVTLHRAR